MKSNGLSSSALHGTMLGQQVILHFAEPHVCFYLLWSRKELTEKYMIMSIISPDCSWTSYVNDDDKQVETE